MLYIVPTDIGEPLVKECEGNFINESNNCLGHLTKTCTIILNSELLKTY